MGNLCWFDLGVKDVKRAQDFYSKVLGWKYEGMGADSNYIMINTGEGFNGGMCLDAESQTETKGISVYFSVDSMEKALELAEVSGGKVLQKKTAIPGNHGHWARIRDTEGNGVCFWSKV